MAEHILESEEAGSSTLPKTSYINVPDITPPTKPHYSVTLSDPQKVKEKNKSFVVYTMATTENESGVTTTTTRRFSDFIWLQEQLRNAHSSCVIPPMPEKSITGNFTPELMRFRMKELTRFLFRVITHPVLGSDPRVEFFLTTNADDFNAQRDSMSVADPKKKSGFLNMVMGKASDFTFAMGVQTERDEDPWFQEQSLEISRRQGLLNQMLISARRLADQFDAMGVQSSANSELLTSFGQLYESPTISTRTEALSTAVSLSSSVQREFSCHLNNFIHSELLDYMHELDEVQETLNRRLSVVRTYTVFEKDAAKQSPDVLAKRDEAQQALEEFSNAARADIKRVFEQRAGKLERFCEAIADMYRQMFSVLEEGYNNALLQMGIDESDESSGTKGKDRSMEYDEEDDPKAQKIDREDPIEEPETTLQTETKDEVVEESAGSTSGNPFVADLD